MLKKHFHLFVGSKVYCDLVYKDNLLEQENWNDKFSLLTISFSQINYVD